MLPDVVLLGNDSVRTRCYLDVLISRGVGPSHVILIGSDAPPATLHRTSVASFDNIRPAAQAATEAGIPVTRIESADVNAHSVREELARLPQRIAVFSVTGGAIVREPLFKTGKRFLHVHPGDLPDFRGSTTIYYSLLAGAPVTASAIFLTPGIDAGPVIATRSYDPPADRREIDTAFDSWIRADLLASVLDEYRQKGRFSEQPQPDRRGETYYIIHPVLKHLAIMGSRPAVEEN